MSKTSKSDDQASGSHHGKPERFSAKRKLRAVQRLMGGESLEIFCVTSVCRSPGCPRGVTRRWLTRRAVSSRNSGTSATMRSSASRARLARSPWTRNCWSRRCAALRRALPLDAGGGRGNERDRLAFRQSALRSRARSPGSGRLPVQRSTTSASCRLTARRDGRARSEPPPPRS